MRCLFRLARTPQAWLEVEGQVLLRWGLFNPNGPTLYCIGTRPTGARGEVEVFYRWMHFLGGEDYCLGYFTDRHGDGLEQLSEILLNTTTMPSEREHLSADVPLFAHVPSLVSTLLPNDFLPVILRALGQSAAIRKADWGRERYLLDKYGSDLFARAGEELREALEKIKADGDSNDPSSREALELSFARYQHIPTFRDWTKSNIKPRELADGDIESWWDTIQDPNFSAAAHLAFAEAWAGASDPKYTDLAVVTTFTEVLEFLLHFKHPWWSTSRVHQDFTIIFGPPGVDEVRARIAANAEQMSITVDEAWLKEVTEILQHISVCQPGQARSLLDQLYSEFLHRDVHIEEPFVTWSLIGGQQRPAVTFNTANITVDGKPFEFDLNTDAELRSMAAPLDQLFRPEWIRGVCFRPDEVP